MLVRVAIQFETTGTDEEATMRSLACDLTSCPEQVRLFAGKEPGWLAVEFAMPDSAQYVAQKRIEAAIRFWGWRRLNSTISFPRTAEEQARIDRENARRRARRRAK